MSEQASISHVLDASALLAYIYNEPGSEIVVDALDADSVMSYVNWAEVLTKVAEFGQDPQAFSDDLIARLRLKSYLHFAELNEQDCVAIAKLRPLTRSMGLGLGDRACLALAMRLGLPVLTCERQWASLNIGVTVNLIR